MANKVKFGLKNCYYALATIGSNGTATYATPVAMPGAVSLSMEASGELTPFYADDIVYFEGNPNSGYSGDLEVALLPESFRKDVLGFVSDANGVVYEDANAEVKHFAFLFQFSGDKEATKHVMYNCTANRPAVSGSTKTDALEPQTETLSMNARPIYNASVNKYIPKAYATPTQATQYNAWESAVYQPTGSAST